MIIIRRKKGWKGKKKVEGMVVEKYWRENKVKVENWREKDENRKIIEEWMKS